jgi:hypothetical protein
MIRNLRGFRQVVESGKKLHTFCKTLFKYTLIENTTEVQIKGPEVEEIFPSKCPLRTYQLKFHEAYFKLGFRFFYLAWSRRLGKEFSCFTLAVKLCMLHKNYRACFVYPFFTQGVDILWDGIYDFKGERASLRSLIPACVREGCHFDNVKKRIRFPNGSGIDICGGDNPESLRGKNYSMYILSEHAFHRSDILDIILPILTNLGDMGCLVIQTTWDGKNHSYRLYQRVQEDMEWYTDFQTVETACDNEGKRYISEKAVAKLQQSYTSQHKFRQEMFMDVDSNQDIYYFGEVMQKLKNAGRIVPYAEVKDVDKECFCFWDLGARDENVVLLVQFSKGFIVLLNAFFNTGKTHRYHIKEVENFAKKEGLTISTHYVPHDGANISPMVNGEKATSLLTFMRKALRINAYAVKKPDSKNVSIQYARELMQYCVIAEDYCKRFIEDISDYRKVWDEKLEIFKEASGAHAQSHAVDAFQTLSIAFILNMLPQKDYLGPIPYDAIGDPASLISRSGVFDT